jgi:hypothetical protein
MSESRHAIVDAHLGDIVTGSFAMHVERWKQRNVAIAHLFVDCIVGEIFWRKTLGRPKIANLAHGFVLMPWTWVHEAIPDESGALALRPLATPLNYRLSSLADDEHFWRVGYVVEHVPIGPHPFNTGFGAYDDWTDVVPDFAKGVPWEHPQGPLIDPVLQGFRTFTPLQCVVSKRPGPVQQDFEVITTLQIPVRPTTPFTDAP